MTRRWLMWVAFEWLLILVAMGALVNWWWLAPIALVFIGTRQHALGVLGHEAVHWAVSEDRDVNDRLANLLCMWPLGSDVEGFRGFHLAHHARVGTPDDPERWMRDRFADRYIDLTPTKKAKLIVFDLLGMNVREPIELLQRVSGEWTFRRRAYCVALGALAVAAYGSAVLVLWGLALLTANFAAMRARMWREHLGPEVTEQYEAKWWERALYLPHHIWRHYEHHKPGQWSIPCWELGKCSTTH